MRPFLFAALLFVSGMPLARAAPTALVTCGAMGRPMLEAEIPDITSVVLNAEGDARITTGSPSADLPVAMTATGRGLVTDGDGRRIPIAWICLMRDEDTALLFRWVRTEPLLPSERCRGKDASDLTVCLKTQLEAAEQEIGKLNGLLSPQAPLALETGQPRRPAPPVRMPSDVAWRAYRDAECGRRLDLAVAAGGQGTEIFLECLIRLSLQRIDGLTNP